MERTAIKCESLNSALVLQGFEQQLSKRILEDVSSRLRKLKNDLPAYNVVFYATDYEELLGLDKYLNIVLPFQFVSPYTAFAIKVSNASILL